MKNFIEKTGRNANKLFGQIKNMLNWFIYMTFVLLAGNAIGQVQLASWNFYGQTPTTNSVSTTTVATGISLIAPSAVATLASGLNLSTTYPDGLKGTGQTATTLAEAITMNEYISFSIAPESGMEISITALKIRPVSQNHLRTFSVFSSVNGFSAANVLGSFTSNESSHATPAEITIADQNHTCITNTIEFRVYIYCSSPVASERVGIGNGTSTEESDITIMGTIASAVIDAEAPTVPSGLTAIIAPTSVKLKWNASTDNIGVTSYEIFKDGEAIARTADTTYRVTGLNAGVSYTFTVRASDAHHNWSAQSVALTVVPVPDTEDPSIPSNLQSYFITANSFSVSWDASSDNDKVVLYEVFRNGISIGTTSNTTMPVDGFPGITYAITVRAKDYTGNWSAQSSALNVTTLATVSNEYKLLEIGNSFTGYNGLSSFLATISLGSGLNYSSKQLTPGGSFLKTHWDGTAASGAEKAAIATQTYNAFVLQPQSQEYIDAVDTMKRYYKLFYEYGKANNTPMYIFAYWHYRCKPAASEQLLIDSTFIQAADYCGPDVAIIPIGRVFYNIRMACLKREIKDIDVWDLYHDPTHPSTLLQYVNALTHYAVIFKENPEGMPIYDSVYSVNSGVGPGTKKNGGSFETSLKMQHIIWETVKSFSYSRVDTTKLPVARMTSSSEMCIRDR